MNGCNRVRNQMGKHLPGAIITMLVVLTVMVFSWYADEHHSYAADRDIEWGRYQNSAENNGVIGDIHTPASYEETVLKWGKQMVSGYTTSFTPPLIIDGHLYTASNQHVYKINKNTGEIVQQSDKLKLNVSYAMNPITYDEEKDQFYVPVMNGRVQCLDAGSLESKWISKEYKYNQTLSPVSCREGLIYTGIWEGETDDGTFFCLDADTGEEVWSFVPSENGDPAHGFYWAGAYVNDKYVVVGSDDGTNNTFAEASEGKFTETAIVYCFDRMTGQVVDRINGVKGDIRCSIVYHQGSIYFASKGGRLYKATLDANGKFGQPSWVQLKERLRTADGSFVNGEGDAMITSTPVVHNGRIYAGAAGSGGQFSADGGHCFAVVRDDPSLSDSSLIYTVPIAGYPQAAPILSTATEQTDGIVRLYFTYNAFPGGIYYFEDSQEATAEDHKNAQVLFRPEKEMRQYCISPLCCDREGTLYLKNDSGHLMAVAMNKVWLDDISVTTGDSEVSWSEPFEAGTLNYDLRAPNGTATVDVKLTIPQGMTGEVNGIAWSGNRISIAVGDETTEIPVKVSKTVAGKEWSRSYLLKVSTASNNADLSGLVINSSNTKTSEQLKYDPVFDAGITQYVSTTYEGKKEFLNIWPETADSEASFRVMPSMNAAPNTSLNSDGSLPKMSSNRRVPVYWIKGSNSAEVDVEVTSPSGKVTKIYHITLVRKDDADILNIGKTPLTITPTSLSLYTVGSGQSSALKAVYDGQDVTGKCTFETTDPNIVTVDAAGNASAAGQAGDAVIWVTHDEADLRAAVKVFVSQPTMEKPSASLRPGTYNEPLSLELFARDTGAQIRYVTGEIGEDLDAPTTTTGTVYEGPISIGEEGQLTTMKIRAIVCGAGKKKSVTQDFEYTVDLREDVEPAAGVSLAPGSITLSEGSAVAFADIPNGTTPEALQEMLANVKASVLLTDGSSIETAIQWPDPEDLAYDPADVREQNFTIAGTAILPEGIDDRGNTMKVSLPVTVKGLTLPQPTCSLKAGTYKTNQSVILSSQVPGASIYYTVTGTSGTNEYISPIALTAAEGAKQAYTIKAYALKSGVKSETASWTITIDKAQTTNPTTKVKVPAAPGGVTAAVYASTKKITVKWNAAKTATSYRVAWKKAGAKTWSSKVVKTRSYTISKLAAKGIYQVRVAAINSGGQGKYSTILYRYVARNTLKLTAGKNQFKATLNKISGSTGYQIKYSLKSNLSGAKIIKTKSTAYTVKKLKAKKLYYVHVMPYKVYGGKTYWGQSIQKSIKTK